MKKSIGRLYLSLTQLQTIITDVEGVVKSRSLVYEDDDANNEIITPMYFLSFNLKNETPVLEKKYKDDDHNDRLSKRDVYNREVVRNMEKRKQTP